MNLEELDKKITENTKKLDVLTNKMEDSLNQINNNSKNIKKNTSALEILHEVKETSIISANRIFAIWLATFLALIISVCYIIFIINDTTTVETNTTQEISDVDTIENTNITNGDYNGENKTDNN